MKEATGELNMTVITIVAIVAISAFFVAFIYPQLKSSIQLGSACSASNGGNSYYQSGDITCSGGSCTVSGGATKQCDQAE